MPRDLRKLPTTVPGHDSVITVIRKGVVNLRTQPLSRAGSLKCAGVWTRRAVMNERNGGGGGFAHTHKGYTIFPLEAHCAVCQINWSIFPPRTIESRRFFSFVSNKAGVGFHLRYLRVKCLRFFFLFFQVRLRGWYHVNCVEVVSLLCSYN